MLKCPILNVELILFKYLVINNLEDLFWTLRGLEFFINITSSKTKLDDTKAKVLLVIYNSMGVFKILIENCWESRVWIFEKAVYAFY